MVSRLLFDNQVVSWGPKPCSLCVTMRRKQGVEDMDLQSLACSKSIWYSPSEGCVSKLSEVSMRKRIPPTHSHSPRLDKYHKVFQRKDFGVSSPISMLNAVCCFQIFPRLHALHDGISTNVMLAFGSENNC